MALNMEQERVPTKLQMFLTFNSSFNLLLIDRQKVGILFRKGIGIQLPPPGSQWGGVKRLLVISHTKQLTSVCLSRFPQLLNRLQTQTPNDKNIS